MRTAAGRSKGFAKRFRQSVVGVGAVIFFGLSLAGQAAETADLVFSTIASGAGRSAAGSGATAVEVISVATMDGIMAKPAASLSYTVEPLIAAAGPAESAVADWCLY